MPKRVPTAKKIAPRVPRLDYAEVERKRFYCLPRWVAVRDRVLSEEPTCRDPFGVHGDQPVVSEVVDHIRPRLRFPRLAFERSNLQALCWRCHSRKTGGGE